MSAADVTAVTADGLGPFVLAAAISLQAQGAGDMSPKAITATAVQLYGAAVEAARDAAGAIPIRRATITGVLSVTGTAAHRTKIGVDTGTSKWGADEMWTEYEEEDAAAATLAKMRALVGQTVTATKETYNKYDRQGRPLLDDKENQQTRTYLAPGSLHVVGENANGSHEPASTPAVGDRIDAARALKALQGRVGEAAGIAAWDGLPQTGLVLTARVRAVYEQAGATRA